MNVIPGEICILQGSQHQNRMCWAGHLIVSSLLHLRTVYGDSCVPSLLHLHTSQEVELFALVSAACP